MIKCLSLPSDEEELRGRSSISAVFGACESLRERNFQFEWLEFSSMSHAFRAYGGFLTMDEVASMLRSVCERPIVRLTKWVATRRVISLCWRGQTLMPAFQFEAKTMEVRPCCSEILVELRGVLDNWEIGLWFAAPNAHLAYASPVTVLQHESRAAVMAARSDRSSAVD